MEACSAWHSLRVNASRKLAMSSWGSMAALPTPRIAIPGIDDQVEMPATPGHE
jgi:hypothetical protein